MVCTTRKLKQYNENIARNTCLKKIPRVHYLIKEGLIMDIASLSMNLTTSQVQNSVSISVLSKSLDSMEALGDGLVKIIDAAAMERSVNPHIGGNIDVTV